MAGRPLTVFVVSVGLEHVNRGLESFTRQCYDSLKHDQSLDLWLIKGSGRAEPTELVVKALRLSDRVTSKLSSVNSKLAYLPEHFSFTLGLVRHIQKHQPDVIFFSDRTVGHVLYKLRALCKLKFKLLLHNGSPVPPPYKWDHVHHPAPFHFEDALEYGESPSKHTLLPIGIDPDEELPFLTHEQQSDLRQQLNLPSDRKIVLSVGAINCWHKRMDYLVREVSKAMPRPYLVMLGQADIETPVVQKIAVQELGSDGFDIRSVPSKSVADYYRAADCAVLASLTEGFGRVYIEALQHGIASIAHDSRVTRFVLGEYGTFADLSVPGELTKLIDRELASLPDLDIRTSRRAYVRKRFAWQELAPLYAQMIRQSALNGQI